MTSNRGSTASGARVGDGFAAEIVDAFEALVASGTVTLVRGLEPCAQTGGATCRIALTVPQPNPAGLPASAEFEVGIPTDPFGRVTLVAVEDAFRGFPHQANDGTLCLEPERDEPSGAARVLSHVRGAIEWVRNAASGLLLQPQEPWELPDFRLPNSAAKLFFIEDGTSFPAWRGSVGKHGRADLAHHSQARAVIPLGFYHHGALVHRVRTSPGFAPDVVTSPCEWMLLESLIFERHRAPKTFAELDEVAQRSGVELWRVLHRALKRPSVGGHRYLLVGAPIPRLVGAEPVEVHWQAVAVSHALLQAALREPIARDSVYRRARLQAALGSRPIPWGESRNVSSERLRLRGCLKEPVRRKRICVLGCGALGGHIATMLARGGAHELGLFDPEELELENLCRHVLPASAVGQNKAIALAAHLRGFYPDAFVAGYPWRLPLPQVRQTETARSFLEAAEVLIDCSVDDSVFRWASQHGKLRRVPVVHMYLNAGATMLTLVASGRHATAQLVDESLHADVSRGRAPFTAAEYDPPIRLETGAGCWSGTFPGRGSDIAMLTASAIRPLEGILEAPRRSRGRAVVIRRRDSGEDENAQPLVEVAFTRAYR